MTATVKFRRHLVGVAKKFGTIHVPAYVYAGLAVHHGLVQGLPDEHSMWTITHMRTGRNLGVGPWVTIKEAKAAAVRLSVLVDWPSVTKDDFRISDLGPRVREALN